jgi:hypothetical protein
MIHDPIPASRRDLLRTSLLAAGAVLTPSLHATDAGTHVAGKTTYLLTPADRELFTTVLAKLRGLLADATEKSASSPGIGRTRTRFSKKASPARLRKKKAGSGSSATPPVGHYTNGGFWLVGTGFVRPALAHGDIELARMLVRDLAANIEEQRLPEYINAAGAGAGAGASGFLMAMPALAIECVLEDKPWPGCF